MDFWLDIYHSSCLTICHQIINIKHGSISKGITSLQLENNNAIKLSDMC